MARVRGGHAVDAWPRRLRTADNGLLARPWALAGFLRPRLHARADSVADAALAWAMGASSLRAG